ncbi:type II toxin-antitoxin system Phd/YefM family antitoxin [Candidatus Gracilibacteria bacterium]|nr:type II toxin-antitoxin system Phd/YefM family antitoxin [Candidatus Gracilibacteria bacterium]
MYSSSDFISVTDVRKDISHLIASLKQDKQKIIFKNNKPTAVLIDFELYEKFTQSGNKVTPLEGSEDFVGTQMHNDMLDLMRSA